MAVNRGSEFLREIAEREGRLPTEAEARQATNMVRSDQGLPPKTWDESPEEFEAKIGTSRWGQSVIDSVSARGPMQGDPAGDINIPTRHESASSRQRMNLLYGAEQAQIDALITGDTSDFKQKEAAYSKGADNVYDERIEWLMEQYAAGVLEDQGALELVEGMSPEEKAATIIREVNRINANKLVHRDLVAMNLIRQGEGALPRGSIDYVARSLTTSQSEGLRRQYIRIQQDELQSVIDSMAAAQGEDWGSAQILSDIFQQDFVPFYGTATRVIAGLEFIPEDLDIATWRKGLPGETRQAIREWFVNATHEERLNWVTSLEKSWVELRKSPYAQHYTRYAVVENMMGLFTDALMQSDDPTDTADRVLGNLDVAIGSLFGVGLVIKRGVSLADMFSAGKTNPARQLASAAGARQTEAALDEAVIALAKQKGATVAEASLPNLPKPTPVAEAVGRALEVDNVKHTTTPNDLRRARILEYTDDADVTLLSGAAKASSADNALKKLSDLLSSRDAGHLHHKMSTWRALPNDVGFEVDAVIGSRTGEGWADLEDLLDDMREFDPYEEFKILKRGQDGKLEELDVSFESIIRYYADGTIPPAFDELLNTTDEIVELRRFFGSRKLNRIPTHELQQALESGWVPVNTPAYRSVVDEIANRTTFGVGYPDPLLIANGDELFVSIKKTHYWQPTDLDKIDGMRYWDFFKWLGGEKPVHGRLLPPNVKFDSLYDAVRKNYQIEEATLSEFSDILSSFYGLSATKRRHVAEIIEWVEEFAKDMEHQTGFAKAPTLEEIAAEFPYFTDDVFEGYAAMREAMDGLYDVYNRRMFREYNNEGYRTMRGTDDSLPNYHGRPMRPDGSGDLKLVEGTYYDPVRRELVELTQEELDDIYKNGGGALKLEFPIDAPNGGKTSRILARPEEYRIGNLSKRPLSYYEGYHFRFYEDPYFIIKRTEDPVIDGVKAVGEVHDEAIRTAGTMADAHRFLRGATQNMNGEFVTKNGDKFLIVPTRQINYTEGSLYQHQTIQKQGRMFWDQRGERLPDVNGNRSKIADPFQAMEKGLALATRQTTQEGLFKAMKSGFEKQFSELPAFQANKASFQMDELRTVQKKLEEGLAESPHGTLRGQYKEAIEYIRYMRQQMGTSSDVIPKIRTWALHFAQWLENVPIVGRAKGVHRFLQRTAIQIDPFARARKIAYGAFMVLRPVRQAFLQSAQISMLIGLDPIYIGTGRFAFDSYALRRGLSRFRRAGFDDGWSDSDLAKAMGLKPKEYKRLVEEFHRSGLMGSVNTHAHNASGRRLSAPLPEKGAGAAAMGVYRTRKAFRAGYDFMGKGFQFGEQNNLTFTYMVALRRVKKSRGIDDLTKMSRADWQEVAKQADGLALAMTRPNKMGYQSGVTGTIFQFMSFQHRALLTMLGFNKYVTPTERFKILIGTYFLWGTNIFGGEEWAKEYLSTNGLNFWGTQELEPGITFQDVLISGFIDAGMNQLLYDIIGVQQDLDIGTTFAPGANVLEFHRRIFNDMAEAPLGVSLLGPVGTPVNGFLQSLKFMNIEAENEFHSPAEKIVRTAKFFAENTVPFASDLVKSWTAIQTGEWEQKNGDKLGVQAHAASIVARAGLGLRTEEELSIYRARRILAESNEFVTDYVRTYRPLLKQAIKQWSDGTRNADYAYEMAGVVIGMTEDMPEGVRREIYTKLMKEPGEDGKSVIDVLAESRANASVDVRALIPHINQSSMSVKKKQDMLALIEFLAEGHKQHALAAEEQVKKEIARRRQ